MQGNVPHKVELRERHDAIDAENALLRRKHRGDIKKSQIILNLIFSAEDIRTIKYLKGETLEIGDLAAGNAKGWQLVCVDGWPLGWGKANGGTLKNKYYSGWRWQ